MYSWLDSRPEWHRESRSRLLASMAIATVITVAFITLITFEDGEQLPGELDVFLVQPDEPVEPEAIVEEIAPLEIDELVEERVIEQVSEAEAEVEPEVVPEETVEPRTDWYLQMDSAVERFVTEQQRTYSLNPVQDELRRQAAEKFRPSRAPVRKEIWENVAVDQLGRKILVSGDCHRVIDDPGATRQDAFREFHQYIVFCSKYKRTPKELPWVDEVRERYVYLQPEFGDEFGDSRQTAGEVADLSGG